MKQTRLLKTLVAAALCAAALGTALAQRGMSQVPQQGPSFQQQSSSFQQIPQRQQQEQTTSSKTGTMATTTGTITTYDPGSDHFMFRPSSNAAPVRYYQTKDTVIVDAQGRTVDQSEIRPGIGATMYYTKSGDRMIVRKIALGQQPTTSSKKKATRTTKGEY